MTRVVPLRIAGLLARHCKPSHEPNCSASRGSDRDCTCGVTDLREWMAKQVEGKKHCGPCDGLVSKDEMKRCGFGRCPHKSATK